MTVYLDRNEEAENKLFAVRFLLEAAEAMLLRTASLAAPEREALRRAVEEVRTVYGWKEQAT